MKAQVGERHLFHGKKVGSADHTAEVLHVWGDDGAPPYLVRSATATSGSSFPGTDGQVLHGDHPQTSAGPT